MSAAGLRAVTFDFFDTLVYHRDGRGRGAQLVEYFESHGLSSGQWRHEILYEVFDIPTPGDPGPDRTAGNEPYTTRLVERLFRSLGNSVDDRELERHLAPVWQILGPAAFGVFADVRQTLRALRAAGYALAIISNWPRGLAYFCHQLDLSVYFDLILASGEVGAAKPDAKIFVEASERLGVDPGRLLHVGDSPRDDFAGAREAGFEALLIDRNAAAQRGDRHVIDRLDELPLRLGVSSD